MNANETSNLPTPSIQLSHRIIHPSQVVSLGIFVARCFARLQFLVRGVGVDPVSKTLLLLP